MSLTERNNYYGGYAPYATAAGKALLKASIRKYFEHKSKEPVSRRKPYKTKKKSRKTVRTNRREIKQIKKGLRSLKCDQEQSMGRQLMRLSTYYNVNSLAGAQQSVSVGMNIQSEMKTVVSRLLYYDPANPGTLIGADYDTGTYSRDVCFKKIYSKCIATNNYITPCEATIYCCQAKLDTNDSPKTTWINGVDDNPGSGVAADTALNQYPTDYDTFNKTWKIISTEKRCLKPGESFYSTHSLKDIDFDPALSDLQTTAWQPIVKAFAWMVVVKGTIGHETGTDDQGILPGGVDVQMDRSYTVRYDSGVNINYIIASDSSSVTANAVRSNAPVADNQISTGN